MRLDRFARPACAAGVLSLFILSVWVASPVLAQPVKVGEGRVTLGLVLRQLNTVGTFMMATAHPDDENNALLALLAKGQGIRTVLVTATRGDGGQNEIGPELFDALAVLRTEELLAAHRLDGAEQYFTRAVDFGYSFSRDETFDLWGQEEILGDFVRMIRTVRPDVVSALSPDGQLGGQHHQASAVLAREAFAAASDPTRFPQQLQDGLRPWQASKFYFSAGFGFRFLEVSPPDVGITMVDVGGYDSLLGRTYAEIGSHARSMHKCQGISPLIALPGPAAVRLRLSETVLPGQSVADGSALFDGVDTSIEGLARFVGEAAPPELVTGLGAIAREARTALLAFERGGINVIADSVLQGLVAVRDLRQRLGKFGLSLDASWEIDFRLEVKERQFEQAVVLAYGLRLEALADDGVVTSDQDVLVSAFVANQGDRAVVVNGVTVTGFEQISTGCDRKAVTADGVYQCSSDLRVPSNAALTNIHWSHIPGSARYVFDTDVPFGVPFRQTPFRAIFEIEISSVTVRIDRPIKFRYGDDTFAGEKRTALNVVPRLAVDVTPEIAIVPHRWRDTREVRMTVTNTGRGPAKAEATLTLPAGWTMTPEAATLVFNREDEAKTVRFSVSPTDVPVGEYKIRAVVRTPEAHFEHGYQVIEYPHVGRRHLVRVAESTIKLIDVEMPALIVGYIEGVGDAVSLAIEQLGATVEFIDDEALAWGDLQRFDVIVTGVRAYERRADLRANNDRLLQYVESGGTLIVQYNKLEFNDAQYGPFPGKVGRGRVTDERAVIRVLTPDHSLFRWPNQIGATTWSDWVQERGLYFLGDKDPAYVDLIELEDSFEWNPGVKHGALVEARYGRGRWIYVGLGLWRQLPAGTVGAYQLLANLLSLGVAE